MRAAILSGGSSLEKKISLSSGLMAEQALREMGIETVKIDPGKTLISDIKKSNPDFAFIALHGRGGEDGTIQDILEIIGLPYTGSNARTSALCFDKHRFKEELQQADIATPRWRSFNRDAFVDFSASLLVSQITSDLGLPLVVKPAREGSAFGIKIVKTEQEIIPALVAAFSYCDRIIIEEYIRGKEIAITILGSPDSYRVLPPAEIITTEPFYNFLAHYEPGAALIENPSLGKKDLSLAVDAAEEAYRLSGARDIARIDMLFDSSAKVLEINTIPGLTHTGPSAWSADQSGFGLDGLIERISRRAIGECG